MSTAPLRRQVNALPQPLNSAGLGGADVRVGVKTLRAERRRATRATRLSLSLSLAATERQN